MAQPSRRPFTHDDKHHLAQFLASIPEHKRTTPATHKELHRRHPEHTWQAWRNHYIKVAHEDIDRRIALIRRQRKRALEQQHAAHNPHDPKGKARARDDDDDDDDDDDELQDDDDEVDQLADDSAPDDDARASSSNKAPRPSTSTLPAAAPSAPPTKERKKALSLPQSSPSPSSGLGSGSDSESVPPAKRRAPPGHKKYTDADYQQLVRVLYRAEQERWTKQRVYEELESWDPDHSAASWQSYHSKNRADVDESVGAYSAEKKLSTRQRKAEDRERERTRERGVDADSPAGDEPERAPALKHKDRHKQTQRKEQRPPSGTDAAPSGPPAAAPRASPPARGSASAPAPAPAAAEVKKKKKKKKKARASLPAGAGAGEDRARGAGEAALMGVGVGAEDRTGALDDDDTQARALESPPAAALGDGSGEEPPFSDEDRARLVFQLAKAEIRVWEKETVFKYMAKKHGHTPDAWRGYYAANVVALLRQVAHKVEEVLDMQRRKREAEAAAAAAEVEKAAREAREREEAERREKERERRKAEEEEEQREREERARLDAEEEERRAAAVVKQGATRRSREAEARAARSKKEAARSSLARAAKPAPASQPPSAPASSAVLTPRSTPPPRPSAAAEEPSPITAATLKAMYGPDLEPDADGPEQAEAALLPPDASGSSLPRLSQYSVPPSPFADGQAVVGRPRRDGDAAAEAEAEAHEGQVGELASDADTDDRELEARFEAAVGAAVKVEEEEEGGAVGEGDLDDAADDGSLIWDRLTIDEQNLIVDTHAHVEALQARERNARPSAPGTATTIAAAAPSPHGSKKRPRQESTAPPAADQPDSQQPPARKRQRVDDGPVALLHAAPAPLAPAPAFRDAAAPADPTSRSSSPAVARRVPRASLAAAVASSSPAPSARASAGPVAPAPGALTAATSRPTTGASAPASAHAPASTPSPASVARLPLKDELAAIGAAHGLSFTATRDLYFCVSALNDMSILRDAALFFSSPSGPASAPPEGVSPQEWDRVRRRVDKYVWSLREDAVVLEGTDDARRRVEERKGRGAVERRREFLRRARMTKVADLRTSFYQHKV